MPSFKTTVTSDNPIGSISFLARISIKVYKERFDDTKGEGTALPQDRNRSQPAQVRAGRDRNRTRGCSGYEDNDFGKLNNAPVGSYASVLNMAQYDYR